MRKIFTILFFIPLLANAQYSIININPNTNDTLLVKDGTDSCYISGVFVGRNLIGNSMPFTFVNGLSAAFNTKQAALSSGSNIKTINGNSVLGNGNLTVTGTQYTLSVQSLTSSPVDGQTIYFGNLPKSPTTTANISKIYIRQSGTIKRAEIYCYSGTAGTNEAWVMHIRKNNTTDTQISSVSLAASERVFSNTNLSISVVSGDYIEIKVVNPTFATNPLTTIFSGYIFIE